MPPNRVGRRPRLCSSCPHHLVRNRLRRGYDNLFRSCDWPGEEVPLLIGYLIERHVKGRRPGAIARAGYFIERHLRITSRCVGVVLTRGISGNFARKELGAMTARAHNSEVLTAFTTILSDAEAQEQQLARMACRSLEQHTSSAKNKKDWAPCGRVDWAPFRLL